MRLPLVIPLDAREDDTEQDGRMTNMVAEQYDELVIVSARPGLSLTDQVEGAANGIVCYNGNLIAVFGDAIEFVETSAETFNAGTNYGFGQVVFYGGFWWISTQGGNQGNTPSQGSSYWKTDSEGNDWDPDTPYALGDPINYFGTPYFAHAPNQGVTPGTPAGGFIWSPTPLTTERWMTPSGTICATADAAADVAYGESNLPKSCGEVTFLQPTWFTHLGGAQAGTGSTRFSNDMSWNGSCETPIQGAVTGVAIVTRIAV